MPRSPSNGRQLGNILDEYSTDRIQRGRCGTPSAHDKRGRLRRWFSGSLHEDISKMTLKRAAGYLAQRLFRRAVRQRYLRTSPFAEIQPVGRPNRGKKQLRFEAARTPSGTLADRSATRGSLSMAGPR